MFKKTLFAVSAVAALGMAAPASAYIIDFELGNAPAVNTGTVFNVGGNWVGSGILFQDLSADTDNDGVADDVLVTGGVQAFLDFNTGTGQISMVGSIPTLGINNEVLLLSGTITYFNCFTTVITSCYVEGLDVKSNDLLAALGIPQDLNWAFFGFTLSGDPRNGIVNSADILNRTVPEPGSLALLGLGLAGLGFAGRRRKA